VDAARISDDELAPQRAGFSRPAGARTALGWYRAALWEDLLHRGARARRYPTLETPVTMVWGLDDTALGFDDIVPATRAYVPNLRVVPIERCGHFALADAPAAVTDAVFRWLRPTR